MELDSALCQREDCLNFLEEQQEIWQKRLDGLRAKRQDGVCSGAHGCSSPLCGVYHKELAMLKGVLLTFRRRIREWQLARDRVEEELQQRTSQDHPQQPASSDTQTETNFMAGFEDILAAIPAPYPWDESGDTMWNP